MANTYSQVSIHAVFAVKGRLRNIAPMGLSLIFSYYIYHNTGRTGL
jgi:hypothetical protein